MMSNATPPLFRHKTVRSADKRVGTADTTVRTAYKTVRNADKRVGTTDKTVRIADKTVGDDKTVGEEALYPVSRAWASSAPS